MGETFSVDVSTDPNPVPAPEPAQSPEGTPLPEGTDAALLEKFGTVEKLAASYLEAEKKISTPAPVVPGGGIHPEPEPGAAPPEPTLPQGVTPEDLLPFQEEVLMNGTLSDESRAQLKQLIPGVTDALIDQQMQGVVAQDQLFRYQVLMEAGGTEDYARAMQWAARNLGKDDIDAYNKALAEKNIQEVVPHVRGLMARYRQATTENPSVVQGEPHRFESAAEPFRSEAEMVEAMKDPEYWKNEAYAQEVQDRIKASMGRW